MALWKARGENLNKELEFRSWHCGRKEAGGSLNKELDHAFNERTLRRLRSLQRYLKGSSPKTSRYLKPLPKGGRRGRGVNEEPKPLRYLKGASTKGTLSLCRREGRGEGGGERGTEAPLRYLKGASKASKVS